MNFHFRSKNTQHVGEKMKLVEYLSKYATPVSVMARRCGISGSAMHKIILGAEPSLKSALAIEDATKGEVTCRELLRKPGDEAHYQAQLAQYKSRDKSNKEETAKESHNGKANKKGR
jgi:DNA-binding transcriptional regulator YdaS (Cro superfamily)